MGSVARSVAIFAILANVGVGVGVAGGAACGFGGAATQDGPGDGGATTDGPAPLVEGGVSDAPLLPDGAARVGCNWPTLQAGAPWPMIGGCVTHAGRSSFRGPRTRPREIWNVDTAAYRPVPSIGADDTVYVPADGDGIYAFAPDGGYTKLEVGGGDVTNTPAIGKDGTLYFGAGNSAVARATDGGLKRDDIGGSVDTSPVIDAAGNVYTASFSQKLVSYDGAGKLRWDFATGGSINGSPAIGPSGDIYIGSRNGKLFAVSSGGKQQWVYDAGSGNEMQSSPVVGDDGTIYIGTMGKKLHAVTPTGTLKWIWDAPGPFGWQMLPALGWDGTIYAATERTVVALRADGTEQWRLQVEHTVISQVIVDLDGTLYVGADDPGESHLYAISPLGQLIWDADVSDPPTGFAIGRDGTLYITCDTTDRVHAFRE